jgi:deoxyhypusine synthase
MRIYFNTSARGSDAYVGRCELIERSLTSLDHSFVWDWKLGANENNIYTADDEEMERIYKEALKNISRADIFIPEVSISSVTQGYLIDYALQKEKYVIAMAYVNQVPVFLKGIANPRFCLTEYTTENCKEVLSTSIEYVKDHSGSRFTMIIPDDLTRHLRGLSKKGVSRSEYIRTLIRKDMEQE